MSMDKQMEMAQLLARFKLQVKRSLGETVDLLRLSREPAYAQQRLTEIEEAADDEELLVMLLRLRDKLVPADAPPPPALMESPEQATIRGSRNYLMGARAW